MADIVLSTLNAKYIHAAFGLRYLMANLGPLQSCARLVEFDINQRPLDIAEEILAEKPRIIGFGVYIWNVSQTTEVVSVLKRLRPELVIILGGPEVSYEWEQQRIVEQADYLITGEADTKFAEICGLILAGDAPSQKVITADLPDLDKLSFPYSFYSDHDIAHRVVYVEASRGCPFSCEFCLSSLEIPVRQFPLEPLLKELDSLLRRGARQLKFVDRTFNLNTAASRRILEFLLERHQPGLLFHFEMVPDRLPEELREILGRFPAGSLQLEVGVQTFNEATASLIQRRQNYTRLEETFEYLTNRTGVHLHADLIAGLPGEDLASLAAGFDRLVRLGPQEIQLGILKRLRGTPIIRHDATQGMLYNPLPPYELLRNALLDFATMQKLRRFARYWDLVGNSGNFLDTTPLFWRQGISPFNAFWGWSEWLFAETGRTDGIALVRLMELVFRYLTAKAGVEPEIVAQALWRDYRRGGKRDKPFFLRDYLPNEVNRDAPGPPAQGRSSSLKRQAKHLSEG